MKSTILNFFLLLLIVSCDDDSGKDPTPDFTEEPSVVYKDVACSECDFQIPTTEWQIDGTKEYTKNDGTSSKIQPGDTLGFKGDVDGIQFINLEGTEAEPIVIINCDGPATVGKVITQKALQFINSKHIIISGAGSTSEKYGLKLFGYFGIDITDYSTDFEILAIEVLQAGYLGIAARTSPPPYPDCVGAPNTRDEFVQENTIIHDNYIHDTEGEGMYIGGSHWEKLWDEQCPGVYEPELHGVRIYNNLMERIGQDAIQVGSATEDVKIYNNIINDFGTRSVGGHMTGFQINPGTTGELFNNIINKGNGFGIFMIGVGDNLIYNNLIIEPSFDGIYTQDRSPKAGTGFYIVNNTIIKPGYKAIGWNSKETSNNVIYNNLFYQPGDVAIGSDGHFEEYYTAKGNHTSDDDEGVYFGEQYQLLKEFTDCIDKGVDVSEYGIETDLFGNKRLNGVAYDIGAHEFTE